ncbi:hypothetical protein [Pandoraea apista]|uniref:hypothetical protein n=1 Tax=Pandoraea apista TaxID=93218 RepID=UPI00058A9198|nr:hypothetical protein [Pandoraea apista]AJE97269.1 hypothetical protein SG18_02150 [Pandoraea apista]AKH71234.1 hypothetical protein XM39_02150 [Pandoraea apista]AKI63506.1 hypothetical protein AA956_19470 [Pandoraea apista]
MERKDIPDVMREMAPGVAVTLLWAVPMLLFFAFVLFDTASPGGIIGCFIGVVLSLGFGVSMAKRTGHFTWPDRD